MWERNSVTSFTSAARSESPARRPSAAVLVPPQRSRCLILDTGLFASPDLQGARGMGRKSQSGTAGCASSTARRLRPRRSRHPCEVGGRLNHSVALCGPLDYPERDLPVAPYTFGCWLGDGRTGGADITSADQEILDHIREDGYVVTHHASTRLQYTISNRPERERRISEALDLAAKGMSVSQAALHAGVGLSAVLRAANGRFPQGRRGHFVPLSSPRALPHDA